MPYYLAIDQGSHSSRVVLFDNDGHEVASEYRPVTLYRRDALHVEHSAAELLDSVVGACHALLNRLDTSTRQHISACGIATQRSTVLAWNSSGEAIGPVLSWQDVRAASQLDALRQKASRIQQLTGLPLSAHYGASKLHWLLNESDAVKTCATAGLRLSPLASYLLHHLVADSPYQADHSNAQRTQLLDIHTLGWSDELSQLFGVPINYLPACKPVCSHYGTLKDTLIPVTAVCGDQNAAIYGAGVLPDDCALVNIGSGAFVLRPVPELSDSGKQLSGIAYSNVNGVQYLREATVNGAGSAIAWVCKKFNINDVEQNLPGWLAEIDDPPLFINTVGGLGSPWWRQGLQPVFIGADDTTDHARLIVAVIESILFMLRANIELMQQDSPLTRLRVSGGLSNVDAICQKLASLCRLPVERVHNPEATARGVAWLAAGRPPYWKHDKLPELFVPALENDMEQRYTQYKATLNQILEKSQ